MRKDQLGFYTTCKKWNSIINLIHEKVFKKRDI